MEKRLTPKKKWERVVTLEPSVTQFTAENLKEKSIYQFRVFAENPVGLGEAAETENVALKATASECFNKLKMTGTLEL